MATKPKKLTAVLVDVIMMTDIPTNMLSTPMARHCVSLSSVQLKANIKSGLKISQQDSKFLTICDMQRFFLG